MVSKELLCSWSVRMFLLGSHTVLAGQLTNERLGTTVNRADSPPLLHSFGARLTASYTASPQRLGEASQHPGPPL